MFAEVSVYVGLEEVIDQDDISNLRFLSNPHPVFLVPWSTETRFLVDHWVDEVYDRDLPVMPPALPVIH